MHHYQVLLRHLLKLQDETAANGQLPRVVARVVDLLAAGNVNVDAPIARLAPGQSEALIFFSERSSPSYDRIAFHDQNRWYSGSIRMANEELYRRKSFVQRRPTTVAPFERVLCTIATNF
jgi:hypothetical protein